MTGAERAIRAASSARSLCLSLERAAVGSRSLARLRAGGASSLSARELRVGLGLAWASGDVGLVRAALGALPEDRVVADPVLGALRDAVGG